MLFLPASLLPSAIERTWGDFIRKVARHRYHPGLAGMLELAMATLLTPENPAIVQQGFYQITNFHRKCPTCSQSQRMMLAVAGRWEKARGRTQH